MHYTHTYISYCITCVFRLSPGLGNTTGFKGNSHKLLPFFVFLSFCEMRKLLLCIRLKYFSWATTVKHTHTHMYLRVFPMHINWITCPLWHIYESVCVWLSTCVSMCVCTDMSNTLKFSMPHKLHTQTNKHKSNMQTNKLLRMCEYVRVCGSA